MNLGSDIYFLGVCFKMFKFQAGGNHEVDHKKAPVPQNAGRWFRPLTDSKN